MIVSRELCRLALRSQARIAAGAEGIKAGRSELSLGPGYLRSDWLLKLYVEILRPSCSDELRMPPLLEAQLLSVARHYKIN